MATARVHLTESGRDRLRRGLDSGADWSTIIQSALDHGTAGLLCNHLLTAASDVLPPDLHRAASEFLDGRRKANNVAVAELLHILDALTEAGIPAMPFKGPALALGTYGDIALRSFRDLDLLIREDHIGSTISVLGALGYRPRSAGLKTRHLKTYHRNNGQDILFGEGRLPVEPHWAFAPRTLSAHFDTCACWRRRVPLSMHGRAVNSLSPEDTLIVLAIHGSKEKWARLIWIADIAETASSFPDLDWDEVVLRARAAGVLRMLLLSLGLAEQMLSAHVPDRVRRVLEADQTCLKLIKKCKLNIHDRRIVHSSVFDLSLFSWSMREHMSDRVKYLFATATTPGINHFQLVSMPESLSFAYPAIKITRDYLALPIWVAGKGLVNACATLRSRLKPWT